MEDYLRQDLLDAAAETGCHITLLAAKDSVEHLERSCLFEAEQQRGMEPIDTQLQRAWSTWQQSQSGSVQRAGSVAFPTALSYIPRSSVGSPAAESSRSEDEVTKASCSSARSLPQCERAPEKSRDAHCTFADAELPRLELCEPAGEGSGQRG